MFGMSAARPAKRQYAETVDLTNTDEQRQNVDNAKKARTNSAIQLRVRTPVESVLDKSFEDHLQEFSVMPSKDCERWAKPFA
jgi:hypothetical protein